MSGVVRRPPFSLAGKVAIVTGAGTAGEGWGNGKATAVLLARQGAAHFTPTSGSWLNAVENFFSVLTRQGCSTLLGRLYWVRPATHSRRSEMANPRGISEPENI